MRRQTTSTSADTSTSAAITKKRPTHPISVGMTIIFMIFFALLFGLIC